MSDDPAQMFADLLQTELYGAPLTTVQPPDPTAPRAPEPNLHQGQTGAPIVTRSPADVFAENLGALIGHGSHDGAWYDVSNGQRNGGSSPTGWPT